jgi:hypothetical protein
VRLEPAEVAGLPLAACLLDALGQPVVATPEWSGPCPGTLAYHAGAGHLLVAPEDPVVELDALAERLLEALRAAAMAAGQDFGRRIEVLVAGLELTSGRPPRTVGTVGDAVRLAAAAIPARTQDLALTVVDPVPEGPVTAPAAVALALVQVAVNAQQHEDAARVALRVAPGPTFHVEWPGATASPASPRSARHGLRRQRWGWGYVQLVADALGGSALPAAPAGPGRRGASLGLGSSRLTLPVACVRAGRVERSTLAWDGDPDAPGFGQRPDGPLAELVGRAESDPGRVAFGDLYRARCRGGRTWLVLGPPSGSARVRDLLRGLAHEQALWAAPEPHATRVHALATLLGGALGDPLPAVPPGVWAEVLPRACACLGLRAPPAPPALLLPDPRLAAFLLAETCGRLVPVGDEVRLEAGESPLLAALPRDAGGLVRLCP